MEVAHIHQNQVVVGAAGDQTEALLDQLVCQDLGVLDDLLGIGLELRLEGLAEAHGFSGDDVLQRAALGAGEHGGVDLLVDGLIVAQNQAAPGTTESLVGGGGDHVCIGDGGGMDSGGHQSGDVGHVHHQIGAHLIGHLAELGKVDDPRIGAGAGDDQLGLALPGLLGHSLVVDGLVLAQAVGDDVEILAGNVDGAAVAQMSSVSQIHAQHRVAGLHQGKEGSQVGVGAGVGLDVGIVAAEELAGPLAGDVLRDVHGVAAAVVPLAGIALSILVGQAGPHGQHHGFTDNVFRGDELDVAALPGEFLLDGGADFRVVLGNEIHSLLDHENSSLYILMCGMDSFM